MKKTACLIGAVLALLLSLEADTPKEDKAFYYSSKGIDRYGDGTVVADGECYALVCTKKGCAFGGFSIAGEMMKPETDCLAAVAPAALDGRCRHVMFVVSGAFAKDHATDVWNVYLLDTRRADGQPMGMVDGNLMRVNGYSQSDSRNLREASSVAMLASALPGIERGALCANNVADSRGLPTPTIIGTSIEGDTMRLLVAGTDDRVTYDIVGGDTPGIQTTLCGVKGRDGDVRQPIMLETNIQKDADGRARAKFFRVVNRADYTIKGR